jgi:hypothetical protein
MATDGVVVVAVVEVVVVVGRVRSVVGVDVVVVVVVVNESGPVVVVASDVEEGGSDEATGPLGVVAEVSVKTSTTRSIGLDHIKRCVLFSEKCARAIVFEG